MEGVAMLRPPASQLVEVFCLIGRQPSYNTLKRTGFEKALNS
jgi:hypothetical protein